MPMRIPANWRVCAEGTQHQPILAGITMNGFQSKGMLPGNFEDTVDTFCFRKDSQSRDCQLMMKSSAGRTENILRRPWSG